MWRQDDISPEAELQVTNAAWAFSQLPQSLSGRSYVPCCEEGVRSFSK